MTLREMNLAVFRREPLRHVFLQPRFEPWYAWQKQFDRLPEELRGLELREVYDRLNASMRYVGYYTDAPYPIETTYADEVKITSRTEGDRMESHFETPHGTLSESWRFTVDRTWRLVEFAAESPDDLPALRWLIERRKLTFRPELFRQGIQYLGDRGEPQFFLPKSPYFALAQQWMKYSDFVFALTDRPRDIKDIMKAIDESYDHLWEQVVSSGLVRIVNFGENIAMAYLSTRYFEEYCIPWYERRAGQLRDAGIFSHIHIDGYFKPLLPYLAELPFDGLEALTPLPQGDVSLEEIHEYIGDKILLDGIPAVMFLRHQPREELQACVERIVELFHPRLVLGISDELPQGGDDESFERLKWVADYSRRQGGLDSPRGTE